MARVVPGRVVNSRQSVPTGCRPGCRWVAGQGGAGCPAGWRGCPAGGMAAVVRRAGLSVVRGIMEAGAGGRRECGQRAGSIHDPEAAQRLLFAAQRLLFAAQRLLFAAQRLLLRRRRCFAPQALLLLGLAKPQRGLGSSPVRPGRSPTTLRSFPQPRFTGCGKGRSVVASGRSYGGRTDALPPPGGLQARFWLLILRARQRVQLASASARFKSAKRVPPPAARSALR